MHITRVRRLLVFIDTGSKGEGQISALLGFQHDKKKDTISNVFLSQLPLIMVRPNVPLQTPLLPRAVWAEGASIGLLPCVSANVPL